MKPTAGQRIRDLRKAKKMSLRELARRAKLSPTYLCFIERDNPLAGRRLSEAALRRIAAVLDFDGDTLVCLSGRFPEDLAAAIATRPAWVKDLRAEVEALGLADYLRSGKLRKRRLTTAPR